MDQSLILPASTTLEATEKKTSPSALLSLPLQTSGIPQLSMASSTLYNTASRVITLMFGLPDRIPCSAERQSSKDKED